MCNGISSIPVGGMRARNAFQRARAINSLCSSLDNAAQRERFRADEEAYCLQFGLDKRERRAVLERDFLGLVDLGAHVVNLDKLAALSGLSTVEAIKRQTGLCFDELIGRVLRSVS